MRMLRHQLLQQRPGEPFINLWLRRPLGTHKFTSIKPGGFNTLLIQHRRHQTCRPDFAVTHHFGIYRIGHFAVQQTGKPLQIVNKFADQAIRGFRREQAADELALITTQRLLNLMCR